MADKYDWLLFDLDNTLLDFHAAERAALTATSSTVGIELDNALYKRYQIINKECWTAYENGRMSKATLRYARFQRFGDACSVRLDHEAFSRTYLDHLSTSVVYLAEAEAVLTALRPKYRLALITNGLQEVQRPRLRASGLDQVFEVIVVSDEIGHAKPHAAFFDYAFAEMGHPAPARTLVIGDNLNADIGGGLAYGTDAAWYNPTGQSAYLPVEPTYELRRLSELLAYV